MLSRRRRHLNGGNGKDVVRASTEGITRVHQMTTQLKMFVAQAHKCTSNIVGSIAASGRAAAVTSAATRRREVEMTTEVID